MGVLLERVQFKFASIVGELCSEPDVLSQFAVWLDLRLAEYKLKGAISLDCSGEEPEACWMRGLNRCKKCGRRKQTDASVLSHSTSVLESPVSQRLAYDSQGSDSYQRSESSGNIPQDIILIKEEQDLFPIEIHQNSNSRKRPGRDWRESVSASPAKRDWRHSDNPANQSLMSVIGNVTSGQQDAIDIDESVQESEQNSDRTSDNMTEQSAAVSDSFLSSEQFVHEESFTDQQGTSVDWMSEQSTSRASGDGNPHKVLEESIQDSSSSTADVPKIHSPHYQNKTLQRRLRIQNVESLPKQTVANMLSGAGVFERWLRSKLRMPVSMVDIPPVILDQYLTEFFTTVRRSAETDYKVESFQALKVTLDRYLKECGYPEDVKSSAVFVNSRMAYKRRRTLLLNLRKHGESMKAKIMFK